jgi:transcriptional activator SPT7
MDPPPALEPVTRESIRSEIGLVHDWFLQRMRNNNDPLVEDEDLPVKQRFPKPRLPPTGKITSPRKRPIREQQQMAKKKRKLEEASQEGQNSAEKNLSKPLEKKLRLEMPGQKENYAEPEKDEGSTMGMMSPPDSL